MRLTLTLQFQVQSGSPAQGELQRGDVITKIEDYDSRDIRHSDAQMMFKTAGNEIRLVVHRDNKLTITKNIVSNGSNGFEPIRCPSAVPPYTSEINLLSPNVELPHRFVI